MGYNTSITICNDGLDQIQKHPEEFVEKIRDKLISGGEFGVGNHGGIVTVHSSMHADGTQLIVVGQNSSTRVYVGYGLPSHHTEDGQVVLLERWASLLGYQISKKPEIDAVQD